MKRTGFFDANWISNFQLVGFNIFVSKCQLFELFNILVNCLTWYLPKSMHYYQDQLDFYSRFVNFFGLSFYLDDFLFFCHGVFCWYFWICKWIAFLPSTWNNLKYLTFSNEQTYCMLQFCHRNIFKNTFWTQNFMYDEIMK